jgi:hypothetical protein
VSKIFKLWFGASVRVSTMFTGSLENPCSVFGIARSLHRRVSLTLYDMQRFGQMVLELRVLVQNKVPTE